MTKFVAIFLGINLLLVGCSSNAPLTENQPGSVKKVKTLRVQQGTVTTIKNVAVLGKKSNVGGTVGSIAGSLLGSGSLAGSLLGSMIGGTVGSSADRDLRKQPGQEITLKLDNGEQVTVTQLASSQFRIGEKVKLVQQDNQAKVVHL